MGRTPCCNAEGLKKGAWTSDEDQKLIAYIQKYGEGGWRSLPEKAGLQRCGKSCRLRWANYLRPDIKRGEFSAEEEQKIIELHASLGNRWSAIARHLPKRTDNEIKNYWNTHLKRRLIEMGIDPITHKPAAGSSSSPSPNNLPPPPAPPRSVSSSAQLLNILAAKLAPSSRSHSDYIHFRQNASFLPSSSSNFSSSSSSASARVLNKMASRFSSPLHCIDTLKKILSGSVDYDANNLSNDSDYIQQSTSETVSDMSRSISTPNMATYSPLDHSDNNLDLLKDCPTLNDSVVSSSYDCESGDLHNLVHMYSDEVNDLLTTYDYDMDVLSSNQQNLENNDSPNEGQTNYDCWNDDFGFENCGFSDFHIF